jgi:hypothetical protein
MAEEEELIGCCIYYDDSVLLSRIRYSIFDFLYDLWRIVKLWAYRRCISQKSATGSSASQREKMVGFGSGCTAAKPHLSSYLEDATHQVEMHPPTAEQLARMIASGMLGGNLR